MLTWIEGGSKYYNFPVPVYFLKVCVAYSWIPCLKQAVIRT